MDIDDATQLITAIYGVERDPLSPPEIAKLAPVVVETARRGDQVAVEIVEEGMDSLVKAAAEALARLNNGEVTDAGIVPAGGVLSENPFVGKKFTDKAAQILPGVSVVTPRFRPVVGAVLLARRSLEGREQPRLERWTEEIFGEEFAAD